MGVLALAVIVCAAAVPLAMTTPAANERSAPLVLRSARAGAIAVASGLQVSF